MGSQQGPRPLSELSPMTQRRNSPSWNQTTKMMRSGDSSSPFDVSASPRLFWQGRESGSPFQRGSENQAPYDPDSSFSSLKRPSLENLKSVSRVKNSAMFQDRQHEYDPTQVYVPQRPLAAGRSLQKQDQGSSTSLDVDDQAVNQPTPRPPSPSKDQASPAKSSLSKASRFGAKGGAFDPQSEIWSDIDGQRHMKSVTFDAAPPQINEYEMTTPDPSSVASGSHDGSYDSEEEDEDISFDRDSPMDRDDSFDASLEDIEKTPVVLPDDWRFISPSNANDELVKEDEDPFTEPTRRSPEARPPSAHKQSTTDVDSNGERRPLPPLPSTTRPLSSPAPYSPGKLAAAFELGSGRGKHLTGAPAPASHAKSDITKSGHMSMSIEDRLRLMMIQDKGHEEDAPSADERGEGDMKPAHESEPTIKQEPRDEESTRTRSADQPDESGRESFFSPPRISRDSILRDIRKSDSFMDDSYECSSQIESSPHHYMNYDPDVPVPSVEGDTDDDDTNSVIVKEEPVDEDLYSIPQYYEPPSSEYSSSKDLHNQAGDDSGHHRTNPTENRQDIESEESHLTPVPEERTGQKQDCGTFDNPQEAADVSSAPKMNTMREALNRPVTPTDEEEQISEPSTPGSVIRHSVDEEGSPEPIPAQPIPEPVATVKAQGPGLKTRPSLTPADMESMAATRRKVSGQRPPSMPCPDKDNASESDKSPHDDQVSESSEASQQLAPPIQFTKENPQRQSSLVKLDVPFSIQEESLGFGLDKEFDRVMETQKVAFESSLSRSCYFPLFPVTQPQDPLPSSNPGNPKDFNRYCSGISADQSTPKQRGYLMRHNTKVIVASSGNDEEAAPQAPPHARGTRSAGSSPRKPSQQTWTTEPWNGKVRRSSMRMSGGVPKKKPVPGAVPPLPGQQSNVQDTSAPIEENEPPLDEPLEDGEERGRLFVKVVGLKNLDLPMPRGERSHFALTLDNGLHCVTTSWLEMGRSAPIGQEFELIVQNDLEFHFTLQMKVDQDKLRPYEAAPSSPTRQKASTLSRVFASPRKRREMELKQQQASQQLQRSNDPNAGVWDRLRTLIARDGSFARAYVSLSDHEKRAFGRPYTVDVACFNEWATEEQPSSVKSKKSATSVNSQRKPPYLIGKLELQLLFVPKPKGAKDEDMPKSMNACIREMRDAETISSRSFEGFLSQQGGDCPFWRRRFFKLQGSKLTAFHETTRQPRATINLAKAAKLIDDRSSLVQKETSTKGGGRRKSAFAEEEEGYMFVEEGFRIRFGNGEVIDFYADNATDKESWLRVLSESVGKGSNAGNGQAKQWTEVVLRRDRSTKVRRETFDRLPANGPPPPTMSVRKDVGPGLPPARPRHKHTQSQPEVRGSEVQRNKVRSMAF